MGFCSKNVISRISGLPARYRLHSPAAILSLVELPSAGYILEIGCGKGYFTEALAGSLNPETTLVALDVEGAALHEARCRLYEVPVHWVCAEPHCYPFVASRFQMVVCAFSLHESSHPERVLVEVHRLLAPGGKLLIVEWQWPETDTSRVDRIALSHMKTMLRRNGFFEIRDLIQDRHLYALIARTLTK